MNAECGNGICCPWSCGRGGHVTSIPSSQLRENPLVLLVTHDEHIRSTILSSLNTAGIEALSVQPAHTVETVNRLKPNLTLLELSSEEVDQFNLCKTLHTESDCWRSPVILITEQELPIRVRDLECGAVDYIKKPLDGYGVLARVRTHLRLQHALDSLAELHSSNLQLLAVAQQSCMPRSQERPSAKFEVAMRQVHHAGGDFYDVVQLDDHQVDYIVADASGHDLSSTYWTLALKTLLVEYSNLLFSPLDAMYLMNRALLRILPEEVFFTASYARLNRQSGQVLLLSAAHTPTIHVPASEQSAPSIIQQQSDVLGAFSDANFSRVDLQVRPGDRLYLFSDGVIDGQCEGMTGMERLLSELEQSRRKPLLTAVNEALAAQLKGVTPIDDALLMGIEV